MNVWAVIEDYGCEGCSMPEAIFSNKEEADRYAESLRAGGTLADEVHVMPYVLDEVRKP